MTCLGTGYVRRWGRFLVISHAPVLGFVAYHLFVLGCTANAEKESFTSLPSDRFSHATAYQYFQPLEELSDFISYAKTQLCTSSDSSCVGTLDRLPEASSLHM